jgi:hypothetical protein
MSATTSHSPDWFLDEVVQPTLDDFLLHRDCIRRGMLAALAVNSLADHIAVARSEQSGLLSLHPRGATLPKKGRKGVREELTAFRRDLADRCGDFALVRDVADATKHARLDRDDAQVRDVSGVQHHVEVLVDRAGRPIVTCGGGPLAISGVVVVLPDGSRHRLVKLLHGAVAFLREEMGP